MDGFAKVEEYTLRSAQVGQHFLCITDHGMMAAVPRQIKCCEDLSTGQFKLPNDEKAPAHSLSPIFAIELYVQNKHLKNEADRAALSPIEAKEHRKSYHLLAIAYNMTGYKNLVQLSTLGWLEGLYYKPRVTHEQILKHKEGVIFTSCCYIGEIGQAFDRGGPEAGEAMLVKYMEMFSPHFYLELMLLDFNKQMPYDAWLVKMHAKYGIPLIISQDCHYAEPEDSKFQRYMLMVQKKSTIADIQKKLEADGESAEIFELQDQNLWMKSEAELNQKWEELTPAGWRYSDIIPLELFEQAKLNTVKICHQAKGVVLDREAKLPSVPNEKANFLDALVEGMKWRGVWRNKEYKRRMEEEFELICRKGFASYFLIQKKFTDEARRVCPSYLGWGTGHEAVGPGRGSGVGSLCNYVLGITDVDPIKHGLLFSRFLSEARGGKSLKLRFTQPPIPWTEENES